MIAEAALEAVPRELVAHPSVKNHAQRAGRAANEILLDRSYHHSAMLQANLKEHWKRGRPDIVHFALMEALSTPLFLTGRLNVYVHTVNDELLYIGANLRIPKSYFRFEGLIIDLFKKKVIYSVDAVTNKQNNNTTESKRVLLQLHEGITFDKVLNDIIKPSKSIGLSTIGIQSTPHDVVKRNLFPDDTDCTFVVGGFPKGHFSNNIMSSLNRIYSISEYSLEAHVVIARILYECEGKLKSR